MIFHYCLDSSASSSKTQHKFLYVTFSDYRPFDLIAFPTRTVIGKCVWSDEPKTSVFLALVKCVHIYVTDQRNT